MSATLYLVLGDEEFLAERAVNAAVDVVRNHTPEVDVLRHRITEVSAAQIPQMLAPTLFSPVRALVLTHTHEISADLSQQLLASLKAADDSVTVVMTHAGGQRGKAFATAVQKLGARVARADKISKPSDRVAFVRSEVRAAGGSCTHDAAQLLVDVVGADLRYLSTAATQLSTDTQGVVTAEAVARYHTGSASATGFSVADAAMIGDLPRALETLRHAAHTGVDPVLFADALSDGVRSTAKVFAYQRHTAYQLASTLSMPPWKIEKAQRVARRWSSQQLSAAVELSAELNRQVRGGESDRLYAVERTLIQLCALTGEQKNVTSR